MTDEMRKKIVIYSHDTFGLGNIRRMLAIAQDLAANDPLTSILIISGSPMLHAFRIPERIDYIKLPCLSRTLDGGYSVKSLHVDYDAMVKLRGNIILSAIMDFDPDLILVDKKPLGVSDELESALNWLQRRSHRSKVVLLLRDILDSPEKTIPVWEKHGYHEAIGDYYDQILVVGSPEIFDLRNEYRFPRASQEKVRYCGYVGRERGTRNREQWRRHHGIGADERLVLVTPGGGEDGQRVVNAYLSGMAREEHRPDATTFMICGPEMSAENRQNAMAAAAKLPNFTIHEFTDDMMSCMDAADLVVCMGGYNTVCELLTLRKRAIVVPRVKPVQEQWIRAERLARLGLVRTLHPSLLSPTGLMKMVGEELDRTNIHNKTLYRIDMAGLPRIRESLQELLYPDSPGTAATLHRHFAAGV